MEHSHRAFEFTGAIGIYLEHLEQPRPTWSNLKQHGTSFCALHKGVAPFMMKLLKMERMLRQVNGTYAIHTGVVPTWEKLHDIKATMMHVAHNGWSYVILT